MAITSVQWNWFSGSGNGYRTIDVNIPPDTVIAQATLHGTSGGGTQYTGIKRYRKRLPTGADQDIDFGEWPSWPPIIFDRVSSVTFAIATGSNQQAWTLARMDHWG
jgi:hypothetical protein